MNLPTTEKIRLEARGGFLFATLSDPAARNALSDEMVADFEAVCTLLESEAGRERFRALVLSGDEKAFCAGAQLKNLEESLRAPEPGQDDPIAQGNRRFGEFQLRFSRIPQVVVAVVQGAAFGGGLGLVCNTDIAIGYRSARFALSETGLGLPPAQIAPFVVKRIGLTHTRMLALSGQRFDGARAHQLGILHYLVQDGGEAEAVLNQVLTDIGRCAPGANAATKELLFRVAGELSDEVLDRAATAFAAAVRGEGREGIAAFLEKRPAAWVEEP
ncbi:MAG: enoyl-CoA hydratase/isomerase family protein [Gammaproteobacteria bacterium AqS3]|nr:enoyl-CoA hydratase/isomerase family protein [Gammaproteobacteria bacterium AqS3]